MLRECDYRQVLEAVHDLNRPRCLDEFRGAAVRITAQLVKCQFAAFNEVDLRTGSIQGFLNIDLDANTKSRLNVILTRYLHENPLATHFKTQPNSAPVRLSEFLSQRQLHGTTLYNKFFRQLETEDQLLLGLKLERRAMIALTFNRQSRSFSDRECALLDALRPHLIQAYDNALCFARTSYQAAQERTLNESDAERLLVVAQGRIVFCSQSARHIMCRLFGEIGSRVPEEITNWLRKRNENPLEIAAPLRLRRADWCVTIRRNGVSEDGVLLTLEESASSSLRYPHDLPNDLPALETLTTLGLTARQSEVLLLLSHGQSNAQIAQQMFVSVHTVRHHLEAIYDKLGVSNRNAAAQRAFKTLHHFSD